jgi:hypothetical protein
MFILCVSGFIFRLELVRITESSRLFASFRMFSFVVLAG